MPHQHKIQSPKTSGLFDGEHISRGFDDAQLTAVAGVTVTYRTDLVFTEGPTLFTVTDFLDHALEHIREVQRALAITLQQMECHALRRFRAYTGQAAEGFDELF